MTAIFDAWVENDDPSYYVRRIDNWLHQFFGLPPECCEYREDCSNLVTIEWNGDVYPCDFFVEDRYRLGNVREQTLEQMLRGPTFRSFVKEAEARPAVCKDCEWVRYCHAGCFRHRLKLGIGSNGVPYLCDAKKRIFRHVFATLRELKERPVKPGLHAFLHRIEADVAAGRLGASADTRVVKPPSRQGMHTAVQRNAPCPCGSGRKFKHCCGRIAKAPKR
jgi:uncharacterized protein